MGDVVQFEHEGEVLLAGEKTDQDRIAEGKALVRKLDLTNREIGQWFNEVKGSREGNQHAKKRTDIMPVRFSAKEICEASGIRYDVAQRNGALVTLFPTEASQRGLSWTVCLTLLPAYNFWKENVGDAKARTNLSDLMGFAVAGQSYHADVNPDYKYRGPWTIADAKRQVAFITGKQVEVSSKQIGETKKIVVGSVEKAVDGLPKKKADTIVKAVAVELERETKKLQAVFSDEVNKKAEEISIHRTESLFATGERLRKKAELDAKLAANRLKGAPALMTKAEFKLVLNCLHPDRAPEDRKEKFAEAFGIIKRLEEGTSWDN